MFCSLAGTSWELAANF